MLDTPNVTTRASHGAEEYPDLVGIWRRAVRSTHHFLEKSDFNRIEGQLTSTFLPAVSLRVAERDDVPIGFAGVAEGNLEMLFVTDEARGTGIGTTLLSEVISELGVTNVDVNEQNVDSHAFYLRRGFTQVGRDKLDSDGRPYPILNLELKE